MPRNASGVYSLPIGAFSPGGLIRSSDHNSNYSDIGTALTQSLATTGVSSMTGPVLAASGSAAAPGYAFAGDISTGFYRSASHQIAWTYNGTQGGLFNSDTVGGVSFGAAVTVTGTLGVTGVATFTAAPVFSAGLGTISLTGLTVTGASTLQGYVSMTSTAAFGPANGTTAQRAVSPTTGDTRFNSTLGFLEFYNGTLWIPAAAMGLPGAQVFSAKNNSVTPSTKFDLTIMGWLNLVNLSGLCIPRNNPGTMTCNLSTNGAGGLDTGSIAASTWYYFYAIDNGTTTNVLASIQYPNSGVFPTWPSGYTFYCYLGAAQTDGSSNLYRVLQKGSRSRYVITAATNTSSFPFTLAPGSTGSYVAKQVTGNGFGAPVTAVAAMVFEGKDNASGSSGFAPNANYSAPGFVTVNPQPIGGANGNVAATFYSLSEILLESNSVYVYQSTAITADVPSVYGWIDICNCV